ncbi:hypothetical protein [Pontibacter pudoricolor]|uniref:hypothetical protein n=1 Tax=Pontibacter pudoricolor TaxID=2694930 RepID=UPI0013920892|nr:hypothetical protein [Pontibacter pudoricolor]
MSGTVSCSQLSGSITGQKFTQRSECQYLPRRVSIGLNYKSGKLKEDITCSKRGIKPTT